jgi:hypothetical protein
MAILRHHAGQTEIFVKTGEKPRKYELACPSIASLHKENNMSK